MKYDDANHSLPFRSPTKTEQTILPPVYLSHATSAFRAMRTV